jgi:hypothetical protein
MREVFWLAQFAVNKPSATTTATRSTRDEWNDPSKSLREIGRRKAERDLTVKPLSFVVQNRNIHLPFWISHDEPRL